MPCTTPCHDYTHRAGRCLCGTNASRAVFGLAPLPHEDEPVETPASAENTFLPAATVALAILVIALAALAVHFH